jgi:hypothetical protein
MTRGTGIRVAAAAAYLSIACAFGCYRTRVVESRDWPVISDSQSIRVRTASGGEYELRRVQFTTAGLLAMQGRQLSPGRDSIVDSLRIPLDSISVVRVRELDKKATAWLLAAAVTASFIVIAQAQDDYRPPAEPRPTVSCPYIYSFDGTSYVFDSETYAGGISRALERTDVDNLESVRDVRGRYRLQLRNERPETQYTDELLLHVADHPAGTRAFPDATGVVHVVGQGTRAARLRAYAGDTIPARAGWELVFPRPKSDRAALVVRVRNTPAASIVLRSMLDLLGRDVYAWYDRLHHDAFARTQLAGWMLHEGGLEVAVERGGTWRSLATLPDVGPAIAKAFVVPFEAGQSDTLRIRLESSPLLWELESVELAPHIGAGEMRTLQPIAALDETGSDVRDALARRDGRYFVALQGSRVTLDYSAPRVRQGMIRSVFAKTSGHYYFATNDSTVSRADVALRVMNDRAFGQRFFMDALAGPASR